MLNYLPIVSLSCVEIRNTNLYEPENMYGNQSVTVSERYDMTGQLSYTSHLCGNLWTGKLVVNLLYFKKLFTIII